jgi:dephospho-CoA kinase
VDILIRRSNHRVIVVEAIKLIETGMYRQFDSLWVVAARQDIQIARLREKRGMDETTALQRIRAQTPQDSKQKIANVVIHNDGSFEDTWRQVVTAWQALFPTIEPPTPAVRAPKGNVMVQRARPREADEIAITITRLSKGRQRPKREEVMAAFGEKAFLILRLDEQAIGLAGWKVENLISRTDDVYLDDARIVPALGLRALLEEVERNSIELQCEISLLFLPRDMAERDVPLANLGYRPSSVQSLGVRAWQEAAMESMPPGSTLLFKQLRQDRVLRPV